MSAPREPGRGCALTFRPGPPTARALLRLSCYYSLLRNPFLSFFTNSVAIPTVTMYHHLISQAGWSRYNVSIYLSIAPRRTQIHCQ